MALENQKGFVLHQRPELRSPLLVVALEGWPDAAGVSTGSLSYLRSRLQARRFAEVLPDDFYVFTYIRPVVSTQDGVVKRLRFPRNEFFWWRNEKSLHDLILFRGVEPHLQWHRYVDLILEMAREFDVSALYAIGGVYDMVPHTWEPVVSAVVNDGSLKERLQPHQVKFTSYEGPSSIHTSLLAACRDQGLPALSLWGHAPIYVRAEANPKVCLGLLRRMVGLLELDVDLTEVEEAAEYLDDTLSRFLEKNEELRLYVKQLEEACGAEGAERPSPPRGMGKIIRDVEDFLRQEREKGEGSQS